MARAYVVTESKGCESRIQKMEPPYINFEQTTENQGYVFRQATVRFGSGNDGKRGLSGQCGRPEKEFEVNTSWHRKGGKILSPVEPYRRELSFPPISREKYVPLGLSEPARRRKTLTKEMCRSPLTI